MENDKDITHEQIIEAILFCQIKPVSLSKLMSLCGLSKNDTLHALETLKGTYSQRGICLVEHGESYSLGTAPEVSSFVSKAQKEDEEGDLGRGCLESLAIILYQGPISKSKVDDIRGVNSHYALRQLLVRGLIEREPDESRSQFLYHTTMQLYQHLGIRNRSELPQFDIHHETI